MFGVTVVLRRHVHLAGERQDSCRRCPSDPRQLFEALKQGSREIQAISGVVRAIGRERRFECHQAFRRKPEALLMQPVKALNQQAGGNEESRRERDFAHDEEVSRARPHRAAPYIATFRPETGLYIQSSRAQEWNEREYHSRAEGHDHRKSQHRSIHSYRCGRWERERHPGDKSADQLIRRQHADRCAECRDDEVLAQKLQQDPSPAAKCQAHANLLGSSGGARQEQHRHIGARDKE